MEPPARGRRVDDLPAPRDTRPRKLHGDLGREHPRPGFPKSIPADCGATMLIHGFVAHSRVNGPGMRAIVYFQGCNLGCASCWNPAIARVHWSIARNARRCRTGGSCTPDPRHRWRDLFGWRAHAAGAGFTGPDT